MLGIPCITLSGLTKVPSLCLSSFRSLRDNGCYLFPKYPQSNGKSEATVKPLVRTSWRGRSMDEDALARALLQYRNTPSRKDGLSPTQKLYGRPVQDTLPAHRRAFSSEWQKTTGRNVHVRVERRQKNTTTDMLIPSQISMWGQMWPFITVTPSSGIFMVSLWTLGLIAGITSNYLVDRFW